ncbi:hypothetical protein [Chlorobium ferrooxidans]|uniref:hypothetical protein n=1 Tax=Chlorobium ferrooxidans TaxID=84205 RepID=UPI00058CA492|nr:hypothetical protein [Chlorobium ferrooxidans]
MALKIVPRVEQLSDLAVLRDLGPSVILLLVEKLSAPEVLLIKPIQLDQLLLKVFHRKTYEAKAISRLLISIYTLCRQRNLEIKILLEGLLSGIESTESGWTEKQISDWKDLQPHIERLFTINNVKSIVKALDLSYDYANLYQSAKILTDIRPIFDDSATEIQGSVISFTFRLYFDNLEGSKNISIALDVDDIKSLKATCVRALKKAKTAKKFMQNNKISKSFICGEDSGI